jgi:hypothetical protein
MVSQNGTHALGSQAISVRVFCIAAVLVLRGRLKEASSLPDNLHHSLYTIRFFILHSFLFHRFPKSPTQR